MPTTLGQTVSQIFNGWQFTPKYHQVELTNSKEPTYTHPSHTIKKHQVMRANEAQVGETFE